MVPAIAIMILTYFVWRKWLRCSKTESSQNSVGALMEGFLWFLIPSSIVSVVYFAIVIYWQFINNDHTVVEKIFEFERFAHSLRNFVLYMKLESWQSLTVLSFIVLLSASKVFLKKSILIFERQVQAFLSLGSKLFSLYSRCVVVLCLLLSISCSYSFFSDKILDPNGKLVLRLEKIDYEIDQIITLSLNICSEELIGSALRQSDREISKKFSSLISVDSILSSEQRKLYDQYNQAKTKLHYYDSTVEGFSSNFVTKAKLKKRTFENEKSPLELIRKAQETLNEAIALNQKIGNRSSSLSTNQLKTVNRALEVHNKELRSRTTELYQSIEGKILKTKFIEVIIKNSLEDVAIEVIDYSISKVILEAVSDLMAVVTTKAIEIKFIEPAISRLINNGGLGKIIDPNSQLRQKLTELVKSSKSSSYFWSPNTSMLAESLERSIRTLSEQNQKIVKTQEVVSKNLALREEELLYTKEKFLSEITPSFNKLSQSDVFLRDDAQILRFLEYKRHYTPPSHFKDLTLEGLTILYPHSRPEKTVQPIDEIIRPNFGRSTKTSWQYLIKDKNQQDLHILFDFYNNEPLNSIVQNNLIGVIKRIREKEPLYVRREVELYLNNIIDRFENEKVSVYQLNIMRRCIEAFHENTGPSHQFSKIQYATTEYQNAKTVKSVQRKDEESEIQRNKESERKRAERSRIEKMRREILRRAKIARLKRVTRR